MDRIGNNAQSKVLPEYEKSTLSNLNYLCLSTHIVHIYIYIFIFVMEFLIGDPHDSKLFGFRQTQQMQNLVPLKGAR